MGTINEMWIFCGFTICQTREHSSNVFFSVHLKQPFLFQKFQDRNADEDAVANALFLSTQLQKLPTSESPRTPPSETEPPTAEPLVAQFAARTIHAPGEAGDERLTTSYWLNVPSISGEDDVNDHELVSTEYMLYSLTTVH